MVVTPLLAPATPGLDGPLEHAAASGPRPTRAKASVAPRRRATRLMWWCHRAWSLSFVSPSMSPSSRRARGVPALELYDIAGFARVSLVGWLVGRWVKPR